MFIEGISFSISGRYPKRTTGVVFDEIAQFKQKAKGIPVLALIPKDTSEFVSPAIKSGIEDLLLIPKVKEKCREVIGKRLEIILKRIDPKEDEPKAQAILASKEFEEIKEQLEADLRHAARGKYPFSLLMIRFTGVLNDKIDRFIERLKNILRETDTVWRFTLNTWLVSCPFTEKSSIIEVERKVFAAFESELGQMGHQKRINLFTATYPQDEDNLPDLMERLFNGIHNSMTIDSISAPLNTLSKHEIENYRNKILKYRRHI
jgi:PleD family two-component response regulator